MRAHDPADPLFLYYAPHLVHDPLQAPQVYLDMMSKAGGGPFDNTSQAKTDKLNERMVYHAMVKALDDQVGGVRVGWGGAPLASKGERLGLERLHSFCCSRL